MEQATKTYSDGFTIFELDEEELALEGINLGLAADGVTPIVSVYSNNTALRNYTYDLVISATLEEDPSWMNTQLVRINYFEEPGPPPFNVTTIYVPEDTPAFNPEDTPDYGTDILEMGETTFAPIYLDCKMA